LFFLCSPFPGYSRCSITNLSQTALSTASITPKEKSTPTACSGEQIATLFKAIFRAFVESSKRVAKGKKSKREQKKVSNFRNAAENVFQS
jgi:hypothetical protein